MISLVFLSSSTSFIIACVSSDMDHSVMADPTMGTIRMLLSFGYQSFS